MGNVLRITVKKVLSRQERKRRRLKGEKNVEWGEEKVEWREKKKVE